MNTNELSQIKILLNNQIEYYFSDSNIIKDSFLQILLKKDKKQYILINILLSFNMILKIFKKYSLNNKEERLNLLKQVIKENNNFKLDSYNKKFKLKNKICLKDINKKKEEIDKKTIYIENLNNNLNEEDIYSIISKFKKIRSIHLPKNNNLNKGYCFIEFDSAEDLENSTVLEKLISQDLLKNKIPIKIYTKTEWIMLKNKFNNFKSKLNYISTKKPNNKSKLIRLLKLNFGANKNNELDRDYLDVTTFQFDNIPEFIDFNKKKNEAILRFKNLTNLKNFLTEFNKKRKDFFNYKINSEILGDQDVKEYIKKLNKK